MTINQAIFLRNLPLFEKELERKRERVSAYLAKWLPEENCYPPSVHQAMRYAALSSKGRYWGIMALFAAEACKGEEEAAMAAACAVECVNAFSVVHESLPGVGDHDALGDQPSVHGAFGEGIAVLAGDALMMMAYELIVKHISDEGNAAKMVTHLCRQIGSIGMVGGLVMGILSSGRTPDAKTVEYIYSHKTGSLGGAAAALGALAAGAGEEKVRALSDYGTKTGTAMMIVEDIAQVQQNTDWVGRRLGASGSRDESVERPMDFVRLLGLDRAKKEAAALTNQALANLTSFGRRAGKLAYFANYFLYTDVSHGR